MGRYKQQKPIDLSGDPVYDALYSGQLYNEFENWINAERDNLFTNQKVDSFLFLPKMEKKELNEYMITTVLTALKNARDDIWDKFTKIRKKPKFWKKFKLWKSRSHWDTFFHVQLVKLNLAEEVPSTISEKFQELYLSKKGIFIKAIQEELDNE
jgi:hypothetical protein|tara:strand:- start:795 stop:1256 length:462 start_codon:yes stop_codon:yes gene_type:complete